MPVAAAALALAPAAGALAQAPRVITDDFSVDRLASDYVVHAGGPMQVSGGVLRATTASPDKVITHNASDGLVDSEFTLQANFKDNFETGTTGAIVKFKDAGNYLRLATTYSSSSIKVTKWDDCVRTDLFTADDLFTLTPNTTYWVRARIVGNVTTVQLWGTDPELGGTPVVTRSYTLTGADATKFGAGVPGRAGIYLDPTQTTREFDNLRIAELSPTTTSGTGGSAGAGCGASPGGGAGPGAGSGPGLTPGQDRAPVTPTGVCDTRTDGTPGDDALTGTAGSDFIVALAGDDRVDGLSAADCLFGSTGRDRLSGGDGADHLRGGAGADRLLGGPGADRLTGNTDRDKVSGGAGADRVSGGAGDDRISGGRGRDRIYGGAGRDRVNAVDGARDRVSCGSGRDVVRADRRDRVARDCERVIRVR